MKAIITLENEQEIRRFMGGRMSSEEELSEELAQDEEQEHTEDEEERFAVASDLANVCEYLEDSEVIKIRLIVAKCEERKARAGHDQNSSQSV